MWRHVVLRLHHRRSVSDVRRMLPAVDSVEEALPVGAAFAQKRLHLDGVRPAPERLVDGGVHQTQHYSRPHKVFGGHRLESVSAGITSRPRTNLSRTHKYEQSRQKLTLIYIKTPTFAQDEQRERKKTNTLGNTTLKLVVRSKFYFAISTILAITHLNGGKFGMDYVSEQLNDSAMPIDLWRNTVQSGPDAISSRTLTTFENPIGQKWTCFDLIIESTRHSYLDGQTCYWTQLM